jgi:phosphate transport system protein
MSGEHSSRQYDLDLEAIRSRVLLMGGLVESQLREALAAFGGGDLDQAQRVIDADAAVNQAEIALDDACRHLIVRRQPAANDLRTVMATVKVITDLERMGDEATRIARAARSIAEHRRSEVPHGQIVRTIAASAQRMLHDALDAFARLDAQQAAHIIADDDLVDHGFRAVMRSLITFMMEDPRTISPALDTLWVAKAIERIGDHATNIAESVIFIVDGTDVRHRASAPPPAHQHQSQGTAALDGAPGRIEPE